MFLTESDFLKHEARLAKALVTMGEMMDSQFNTLNQQYHALQKSHTNGGESFIKLAGENIELRKRVELLEERLGK